MTKSYRLRTKVDSQAEDQELRVNIDQDFDFLEILSLKLTQSDVYRRFCADYGVIAGRVVANGGFGIPNARVSIFVPIQAQDINNPIITSLYPYSSVLEKNEDGYRYNLLPYEPSYEGHVPTGTFPSREDVLNRKEVLEIYEKYYKYTVKTNDSGDFMIVGVPIGDQQIVVDVDLSDMGCFSLRPSDLIRMGRATREQFDGNNFRSSTDLASLPQIVNFTRNVNVSSFWGEAVECQVGITRVDFDLRDLNINIEPTALFMGSIFSSSDEDYLKNNCKPKTEQGDLCGMVTGPGTILAIRQTINLDTEGRPILEQYSLPSGGKVIDENGAFVVDVPMNLDYLTTDEYGNFVISQDPKVGIPSKGKYRFKVKYDSAEKDIATLRPQSPIINNNFLNLDAFSPKGTVLRANYLIPNIKEYGWKNESGSLVDPATKENLYKNELITLEFTNTEIEQELSFIAGNNSAYRIQNMSGLTGVNIQINNVLDNSKWIDAPNGGTIKITVIKKTETVNINGVDVELPVRGKIVLRKFDYDYSLFQRSYSFSLDWDDYVSFNDAVNCFDTFYELTYNKVYTVSQLIDEYRKGTNRGRFLGIKEILQRSCQTEVNKFPVNDGVRNFDLLYFILAILFNIISILLTVLIPVYSLVKFLWNKFAVFLASFFIIYCAYRVISSIAVLAANWVPNAAVALREVQELLIWGALGTLVTVFFKQITSKDLPPLKLPMLTYPDCSACDCGEYSISEGESVQGEFNISLLADINTPQVYQPYGTNPDANQGIRQVGYGQVVAGRDDKDDDLTSSAARTPRYTTGDNNFWTGNKNSNPTLPIPERINLYNTKAHYFNNAAAGGSNRIKVFPNYTANTITGGGYQFYEDQPLVILTDTGFLSNYSAGTMLSFSSVQGSKDPNISASTQTKNSIGTNNVTGTTLPKGSNVITISYADPDNPSTLKSKPFTINQDLYTGTTQYNFPADIEYYQVITGYTFPELKTIMDNNVSKQDSKIYSNSFWTRVLDSRMLVFFGYVNNKNKGEKGELNEVPIYYLPEDMLNNMEITVLMKGVDPYSPRQNTRIDISKIFGLNENTLRCESKYKLNIPIQTGLILANYSQYTTNQNTQIFYQSSFFTASTQTIDDKNWKYSAFTTNNHNLYSSYNNLTIDSDNTFKTNFPNGYYDNEYIMGGSQMIRKPYDENIEGWGKNTDVGYYLYNRDVYNYTATTLNLNNSNKLVMRSDRLPRSDKFDNNFVLAQNKTFAVYGVNETGYANQILGGVSTGSDFSTGQNADFEESYGTGTTSVLSSFSCDKMIPIGAYEQGDNNTMRPKPETDEVYWITDKKENKRIVGGCYQFCVEDLTIGADLENLGEWKTRFLIGLAICRNVFGMTFTNQWINGALYMPGFQNDKEYPNLQVTNPNYIYCEDKIVFRIENNSFFYRSSPYSDGFYGMPAGPDERERGNQNFLGNPTTIMDLGPKDNIIKNICAQPEFQGYFAGRLLPTTFNSLGDLLQLFVVSRLSNKDFLNAIIFAGNLSVGQFFSRRSDKIDGDFAQLASINSEFGVVPFSPESYQNKSLYFNQSINPVIGVFYTGDTEDRDYVTPGRDIFIDTPKKFGFNQFGRKSQIVPMYKWKIDVPTTPNTTSSIFGSEKNDWYTGEITPKLFTSYEYQNIDRLRNDTYFQSNRTKPSVQRPGYIYSSSALTSNTGEITGFTYDPTFTYFNSNNEFLVGAPFHFYFGLKIGKTSLDKFIKDYAIEI
jgi:hypothetical protein